MGVIEKLVGFSESKPEDFFDKLKMKTSLGSVAVPKKINHIDVLEKDGESVSSVMRWTYVLKEGGTVNNSKEKIQQINDDQKTYLSSFFEGHIGSLYDKFLVKWVVIEEDSGNSVKVSITFVKKKTVENVPDPTDYLDLFCDLVKGFDHYRFSLAMKGANMTKLLNASLNQPHHQGFAQVAT